MFEIKDDLYMITQKLNLKFYTIDQLKIILSVIFKIIIIKSRQGMFGNTLPAQPYEEASTSHTLLFIIEYYTWSSVISII